MLVAMPHLFCFGFGYCAAALGARLVAAGWRVSGTSRTETGIATDGVTIHPFARDRPLDPAAFREATHLLVSIPPDDQGDPVLDRHAHDLRSAAAAWVGYLSTTGVYGDHQGGWVDEATPVAPVGPRGRRRVLAEEGWLATGLPVHLFRLAGIYGPGRGALESVRAGRARRMVKPGQYFSRIHVADVATVLETSIARPRPGAIYNLADDLPAPPQDVIAHACDLLDVARPPEEPFDPATLSPMAASFYGESKRVRNDLIKRELGVRLAYPTYREGLAADLAAERG
jgi:nucleoside-diphosphate-sugar epimerase